MVRKLTARDERGPPQWERRQSLAVSSTMDRFIYDLDTVARLERTQKERCRTSKMGMNRSGKGERGKKRKKKEEKEEKGTKGQKRKKEDVTALYTGKRDAGSGRSIHLRPSSSPGPAQPSPPAGQPRPTTATVIVIIIIIIIGETDSQQTSQRSQPKAGREGDRQTATWLPIDQQSWARPRASGARMRCHWLGWRLRFRTPIPHPRIRCCRRCRRRGPAVPAGWKRPVTLFSHIPEVNHSTITGGSNIAPS